MHWALDVAENLAALRHVALKLPRQERTAEGSRTIKRFRAALAEDYLQTVLTGLLQ